MHLVLTTATFDRQARGLGLTDAEEAEIIARIGLKPKDGVLIPGSGSARKLRHGGRGRGKSGQYRTIHYFAGPNLPIFLLAIYRKSDADNLSAKETADLAKVLRQIASNYRKHRSDEGVRHD